jgi:hypothetical protein
LIVTSQALVKTFAIAAALIIGVSSAEATVYNISTGNTTVNIDPDGGAGVYDFIIDGHDQLQKQWFWYRLGDAGPELPLSAATLGVSVQAYVPSSLVSLTFTHADFEIDILFLVTENTSLSGDLVEIITVTNDSEDTLHLFKYANFDMAGAAGDVAMVTGGDTATQTDQSTGAEAETVVSEGSVLASTYQAGDTSIEASLNDSGPTTLNGAIVSLSGTDAAWAWQWDVAGGAEALIGLDNLVTVPEPASMTLIALGAAMMLKRR